MDFLDVREMTKFADWCVATRIPVSTHSVSLLVADPAKQPLAVDLVAHAVPGYYVTPQRVVELLQKLGSSAAAKFVKEKLPTAKKIRSGDLAEILCTAYVVEETSYKRGINRLRWKDHRNMSMRGEDVLAFNLGSGVLKILKGEVKSRAAMTAAVITEAREALSGYQELPSPHAISFVADRLNEIGDKALRDAIDKAQLMDGLKANQVTHMLFTFSGSNPSNLLKTNLLAYTGTVPQQYVGLQVKKHQAFIKDVFESVGK